MKTILFSLLLCVSSVGGVRAQAIDLPYLRYAGRNTMIAPPFAYSFNLGSPDNADIFYVARSNGFPLLLLQTRQTAFDPWSDLPFDDRPSREKESVRALYASRTTKFGILHPEFRTEFRIGVKFYRTRSDLGTNPAKWPAPEIVWSDVVKTGDLHETYGLFGAPAIARQAEKQIGISLGTSAEPISPIDLINGAKTLDVRAFEPQSIFPVH